MYIYTNFMCNFLGFVQNFSISMCMLIVLVITIHLLLVINMSALISCHCVGELRGDCGASFLTGQPKVCKGYSRV